MHKVYYKEMLGTADRRIRSGGGGRPQIKEQVQDEIVRLYRLGELTCKQIASAVGVSEASVYRTLNRRTEKGTK